MVDQTFKGIYESLSHMCPNSGLDLLFGPNFFLEKNSEFIIDQ